MVDGGADLMALQELMGHSYLSSTQVYAHVSNKAAVKNFKKSHPRAS
jgi:integrase/recombinase XerC